MLRNKKFDDKDLQETWDNVQKWQEMLMDHVEESQRVETAKNQLALQVKCLEEELSKYKTLIETHEKSRENWIRMVAHANEIKDRFSNLTKEKDDLSEALKNEKKMRTENEAMHDETRRNIENEFRREIRLTKDSADKIIAEKEEEYKAQLEKYKMEISECQRNMENKVAQYEEKLLKMNSELANAKVEIWSLQRKCHQGRSPSATQSAESFVVNNVEADAGPVNTSGPKNKNPSSSSISSSQKRAALYFTQMSTKRELFASRHPSTSARAATSDDPVTEDDDALTENEAARPGGYVFKKKMSVRSFPAVKKKKLLSSRTEYM